MTPAADMNVDRPLVDTVHLPVLLDEIVRAVAAEDGELVVDGTFGAGGYTTAILQSANCAVCAIDRDPDAIARSAKIAAAFGDRFTMLEGCFGDMGQLLPDAGHALVDAVVLDIGVSSYQLDEAVRGFSFQANGPLDMRMSAEGMTAADVVNEFEQDRIADILYEFGEEHKSRRIAAAIVAAREEAPIETTLQLAEIVAKAIGFRRVKGKKKVHPATKTFQALRIFVNDELGELARGLEAAERILKPGGRLVVVAFHSLEDRMVKKFMQQRAGEEAGVSRHMPVAAKAGPSPTFALKKRGAIKPSDAELDRNPRARSSRLRVAVRTDAPAWQGGDVS